MKLLSDIKYCVTREAAAVHQRAAFLAKLVVVG